MILIVLKLVDVILHWILMIVVDFGTSFLDNYSFVLTN